MTTTVQLQVHAELVRLPDGTYQLVVDPNDVDLDFAYAVNGRWLDDDYMILDTGITDAATDADRIALTAVIREIDQPRRTYGTTRNITLITRTQEDE